MHPRARGAFPTKRTLAMFREWFEVELYSTVLDVIDNEVIERRAISKNRDV